MWDDLSVTPMQGVLVILSTAGIYLAFVALVRLLGQRALARMSSSDLATVVALGAVLGRAALGYTPTLSAGLLALATLFAMQALAGQLQRWNRSSKLLNNPPILLMSGSEVLRSNLKQTHLVEEELWPRLRLAGIRNRSEVACVILEPTGEISVIKRGAPLEHELLANVRGVERLDTLLFETGTTPFDSGNGKGQESQ